MRTVYKSLLRLHPREFRRSYTARMLCIFDESAESRGALLRDCLVSAMRQWMLRRGAWMVAPAISAACLEMMAGGLVWLMLRPVGEPGTAPVAGGVPEMRLLMQLIVWSAGVLVLLVTAASIWVAKFLAARCS